MGRRARDAKKREAKKKSWIMSHMSSVLGRLKSAKEEKPAKLKPHAAAPWHKPVQEEAMVQKDDVSDELDEFEKDADEGEEEELEELGTLASMQHRKKKL